MDANHYVRLLSRYGAARLSSWRNLCNSALSGESGRLSCASDIVQIYSPRSAGHTFFSPLGKQQLDEARLTVLGDE